MRIERLIVGPVRTNCYVLYSEEECIIIDPGGDSDKIIRFVKEKGLKPKLIIATHAHFDHVLSVDSIRKVFNIPFLINYKDHALLQSFSDHAKLFLDLDVGPFPRPDSNLSGGDTFELGGETIKAIETPGHTIGSTSLVSSGSMFTGDFLFERSIGRIDVRGSDDLMRKSLKFMRDLNEDLKIYPGHGNSTTLYDEKKNNPFLTSGFLGI